jgi:hypothetical protein
MLELIIVILIILWLLGLVILARFPSAVVAMPSTYY